MQIHGSTTMSEFFGDFVIYRRLEPCDARLPGLPDLWESLGWPAYRIPRKSEPAYADVVAEILRQARRLDAPGATIRRLIYIGDTRMNDGTAFINICEAGGWDGRSFIGAEKPAEAPAHTLEENFYLANRWAMLGDFVSHLAEIGFTLDEETVAVIDMDKTTVGARGRNDKVIDNARVQAVHETVAGALGDAFDADAFRLAYDTLNQTDYHPFTGDNQDILAYLCLVIGGKIIELDEMAAGINSGAIPYFDALIRRLDEQQSGALEEARLLSIHRDVLSAWDAGDPTPFKAFRYREFDTTTRHFDAAPPAGSLDDLLASRIMITEEVRATANYLKQQGVLIFGLSDKPDEASVPDVAAREAGRQPLHRCPTLAAGEKLSPGN